MNTTVLGLHHITAITYDAQKNIDFYTKVLGLKFVKLSVNQDDPGTHHIYFGDRTGSPGTVLTFFAWPGGRKGQKGVSQAVSISFSIPENSMSFWMHRLTHFGISFEKSKGKRFDDNYLTLKDTDDISIELVADSQAVNPKVFDGYGVPPENAIRGFYSVTLLENSWEDTGKFLTEVMGYSLLGSSDNIHRYTVNNGGVGAYVDVQSASGFIVGSMGTGIIHHVAFRVANPEVQKKWHEKLSGLSDFSPIIDRTYFTSIYFHEPGGVLFEIATDGPGFTIDESENELGTSLKLTPLYEPHREELEKVLPKLNLPKNA